MTAALTTVKLPALPPVGRWIVDTETAVFDLDLDARIGTRWDSDTDGAGQLVEPETFVFDRVECVVGAPAWIERWLIDADPDVMVTSVVLGITPHDDAVIR